MKPVEMYETKGGKRYNSRELAIQAELAEDIQAIVNTLRAYPVENWPVFMPKHSDNPEMFILCKLMIFHPFRIGCKLARIWRRYQKTMRPDDIPF